MATESPPSRSHFTSRFLLLARLAALVALTALSGCATMMAGGPDRVPVSSNPSKALVYVDNAHVGQTPMMVTLDRAKPKAEIRLEQPGFAPVIITREKVTNGWIFGNILIGGLIGIIIDTVNNNASKFEDTPIAVGFGGHPAPGPESDPRVADCKQLRKQRLQEAMKLTDKRERLEEIRRAPTCDDAVKQ